MIIGVTGSFGSGKTTVANIFSKHGFIVINADKLYHGIYNKNKSLKAKIKKEFGTTNRNKIKKIVFNDYKKLKKLNKITHPIIIKEIKKEVSSIIKKTTKKIIVNNKNNIKKFVNIKNYNGKNRIANNNVKIIIDAPLLIETKLKNYVDKIIVVKCSKRAQINRILKKKKYSKKEINQIIKSQMPLKEKLKYADFVVDNNRTIKETERQVKAIMNFLQKP